MREREFTSNMGLKFISLKSWKTLKSEQINDDEVYISICVSTWNRPFEIIVKSLESILKQKFNPDNYEIIIVDDATTGEFKKDIESTSKYITDTYPKHNIRFYFNKFTRCYIDTHVLNVAYRRSIGEIILQSQSDVIHLGETLEATWRHHNNMKNLWLCPLSFRQRENNLEQRSSSLYPHELGSSVRKEFIHNIEGRNEKIKIIPADVDFHFELCKGGVVFGIDSTIRTIHQDYELTFREDDGDRPERTAWPGLNLRNSDGTWSLNGKWGELTDEEEESVIKTKRTINV